MLAAYVAILLAASAGAHSGGTDAYGCHAGTQPYHSHNNGTGGGENAGAVLAIMAVAAGAWYVARKLRQQSRKHRRGNWESSPVLRQYDDNGNGRISCREARRHNIGPLPSTHPAYAYMNDRNGDGEVCERKWWHRS